MILTLSLLNVKENATTACRTTTALLPNKQPLCVIRGMGDPAVGETLARVQKARAVAKRKAAEAGAKR
jgi:hypothetical protein